MMHRRLFFCLLPLFLCSWWPYHVAAVDEFITPINSKVFTVIQDFIHHVEDTTTTINGTRREDPYVGPFRFTGTVPDIQAWLDETMAEGHQLMTENTTTQHPNAFPASSVVPHLSPGFSAYLSTTLEKLMQRKRLRSARMCAAIGDSLHSCGFHLDPKLSRQSITLLSDCIFGGLRQAHVAYYETMATKRDKTPLCTAAKSGLKRYQSETRFDTLLFRSKFLRESVVILKRILVSLGVVWLSEQVVMTFGDIGDPPLIDRSNRQAFRHFINSIGALVPFLMILSWAFRPL